MIPGGIMTQDPNSPEYMIEAWKAAKEVSSRSPGKNIMIPMKVLKAQSQVVAGMNYILEVLFGESTCPKNRSITLAKMTKNCRQKQGGSKALYKVEIYERPWENFEQFTVTKIRGVASGKCASN
ncbi:cystatin domain protein [Ancylostoma caninum]|uniref:Cystatin domain protein n=1 Tax=Ancylostoma caninum TaxID=29170 RepID=A0A368GWP8_ANCCA|nr:cystatin domain protein [Ancylostoma caninum]